jgi:hypothetical protein
MALIVEDGTGKVDAESYISVAEHRAYCLKFGLTPSATDGPVEISLRKATAYMVAIYRGSLQGGRTVYNQALDFPRWDCYRDDTNPILYNEVPVEVKACCSELAIIAETSDLMPTSTTRGKKMVKIGPLTIEYDGSGPQAPVFAGAVTRMGVFLKSGNGDGFATTLVRG